MQTEFVLRGSMWRWTLGVLLLAPIQLGAKGCETGVVGDDGNGSVRPCGGMVKGHYTCAADEYCRFAPDDNCGSADGAGYCTAIPQACTENYSPVCGCDGETYDNECIAAMAGVSVTAQGYCDGIARTCGANTGITCAAGEFCNVPVENLCSAADGPGICTPIPEACDAIYSPVCGCDGKTYSSDCAAAMASISVASVGACERAGKTCGANTGITCAAGEFCNVPVENLCSAADGPGTCTAIPQICTANYLPVCGCDGKTYGNACNAAAAGISVAADGECGS